MFVPRMMVIKHWHAGARGVLIFMRLCHLSGSRFFIRLLVSGNINVRTSDRKVRSVGCHIKILILNTSIMQYVSMYILHTLFLYTLLCSF